MTDPIPGGEGWAQTVVEGVAEGEQTGPVGSSSEAPSANESDHSPPTSDETETEIVELDDLDPTDETTQAQDSHEFDETAEDAEIVQDAEIVDEPLEIDSEPQADLDETGDPVDEHLDGTDVSVENLVTDLERVSVERDQYLEASRRLQAEFENYKKQVVKREATARDRANDGLIGELLPVLDAFDGAVANGAEDVAPMRSTMLDALAKQGLERIDPAEDAFDPEFHEAVMHEDDAGQADGPVVAEVLRAGYSWKGRVLRPAMVKTRG